MKTWTISTTHDPYSYDVEADVLYVEYGILVFYRKDEVGNSVLFKGHSSGGMDRRSEGEVVTTSPFDGPPRKSIPDWQTLIHSLAIQKGWWDTSRSFPEVIALCHSELSEALEAWRVAVDEEKLGWGAMVDGKPEGVAVELVDCVIRILDWFGWAGIDFEDVLAAKHAYNETRPHRHGGKRA